MQKIQKIFLVLIGITILGIYLKKDSKRDSLNQKTFIVGTAGGYAPFVSISQNGDYEGFDIDIAQELAKKLDSELIIKDLGSMSSLFIALEQGKIDAIIWALSITQERLAKVAMIRYQGDATTSYPLLFWNEIPNNATSINELQNASICVESGSCQEAALSKYPFLQQQAINHVDDGLLNIQYKKADGMIAEPAIAKKFQQKYPSIKVIDLPLSPEDQIQGIGIAIKKENIQLVQQIKDAIKTVEDTKVIEKLEKKWGIDS